MIKNDDKFECDYTKVNFQHEIGNESCSYLRVANLYFYVFLLINFLFAETAVYKMSALNVFNFVLTSLSVPIVVYYIINV
jgi:hypothetical protein